MTHIISRCLCFGDTQQAHCPATLHCQTGAPPSRQRLWHWVVDGRQRESMQYMQKCLGCRLTLRFLTRGLRWKLQTTKSQCAMSRTLPLALPHQKHQGGRAFPSYHYFLSFIGQWVYHCPLSCVTALLTMIDTAESPSLKASDLVDFSSL